MKNFLLVAGVVLLSAFGWGQRPRPLHDPGTALHLRGVDDEALFRQTASQLLAKDFSSPDISYLLLEIRTRSVIAKRWENSEREIPIGSLVKPFTAIAYAETHEYRFPEFMCTPGACWYPQGHGKMDIVRAVEFSCNAYFTQLAEGVNAAQVQTLARRFGLNGPGISASPDVMAGKFGVWQESPESLVKAYAELLARRDQPGVREIAQGMTLSAREGTAAGISRQHPKVSALAKTGTAPCTHSDHAPGDGFVVMLWPAESPKYALLLRQHSNPGAHAAAIAGSMLTRLQP